MISKIDRACGIAEDKLIEPFEGCRLVAYRCPAGIWTIGHGETEGVREGDVWTQEHADAVLRRRVRQFALAVVKRCPQLLNESPERIAACISLAYNIGVGAFAASSVCRLTKFKEYARAAASFLLWNKGGGRVLRGLDRRRKAESAMYMSA